MATRTGERFDGQGNWAIIRWLALASTDDGQGVEIADLEKISVQAVGDATTVIIQGSNDGGVTWHPLGSGAVITLASAAIIDLPVVPLRVRPLLTGAGASTAVYLVGRKGMR